jgi:cation diffusion facilitator family transporter
MFVELGYGVYSNNLGLISDSFHMLSDCISLFVALGANYVAQNKADQFYTYGFERVEVLSGMFNGFFLIFVGINVFIESIERIYEP